MTATLGLRFRTHRNSDPFIIRLTLDQVFGSWYLKPVPQQVALSLIVNLKLLRYVQLPRCELSSPFEPCVIMYYSFRVFLHPSGGNCRSATIFLHWTAKTWYPFRFQLLPTKCWTQENTHIRLAKRSAKWSAPRSSAVRGRFRNKFLEGNKYQWSETKIKMHYGEHCVSRCIQPFTKLCV